MLSFEVSAIDVVLVITVVVLLILYMKKFSVTFPDEQYFKKISRVEEEKKIGQTISKDNFSSYPRNYENIERISRIEESKEIEQTISEDDYSTCPRGFGNIKKLDENNSVNDKCLGCYKIMQCYGEEEDNSF